MKTVSPEQLYGYLYKQAMDYIEQDKRRVQAAFDRADKKARVEFSGYLIRRMYEIFTTAVSYFYAGYTPRYYHRTYSLYKLMSFSEEGGVLTSYSFNPDKMTTFRHPEEYGDSLYDYVFKKGWHGGSPKDTKTPADSPFAHPEPGVPYWRYPVDIWWWWGHRAAEEEESPFDEYFRNVREASKIGGEFPKKLNKIMMFHFNKELNEGRR